MVVLNRIYTRTGDDGTTSLGNGERRKKYDLRVESYGTLDEANAVIGIAQLHTANDTKLDAALSRIQNDLFDVEAELCLSQKGPGGARMTVTDAQVSWIEKEIDEMNADLQPLKSFVLPGGTAAAANLHLARTVCRRAERCTLSASRTSPVRSELIVYLNRLSDLLFVLARYENQQAGLSDIPWRPR